MRIKPKFSALLTFALLIAVLAFGISRLLFSPTPVRQDKPKFTYWAGLIFSDRGNELFRERVNQWGKEHDVEVEVVFINQDEYVQRLSAAIAAGTMPDAMDLLLDTMHIFALNGQLESIDDLYMTVGDAHDGWLDPVDQSMHIADLNNKIYGIPYATDGSILFRRNDILEADGFPNAPETWEELSFAAASAQKPPQTYGMGFALSFVGDGDITTTMLQSYGGRIADDAGKNCTIDSRETREFLTWITNAYTQGLFPPGVTTWDGAGDNTAYQSGSALYIANPGSVYLYMRDNDVDLAKATRYSALPGGPVMRLSPFNTEVRVIPTASRHKELARDLITFLADDEFMSQYYGEGVYGPVLESQTDFPIFINSPAHAGLLDISLHGTPAAYPDANNAAFAEYRTNYLTQKMVQRIVVDGLSIDAAIEETQEACQEIYNKYQ